MELRRAISVLIALAFVLTPLFALSFTAPTAQAVEAKEGTVTTTKEGWETVNFVWDEKAMGKPFTMNLSLNKGWSIDQALVGVSGEPVITDEGTEWETVNYPEEPKLDVGRNGDDWEWPGAFGHQAEFANDSTLEEPTFSSKETLWLYVPLPAGTATTIKDIKFDVNNTQSGQFEYRMTVGSSTKTVWYKSSIGFSKGPFVSTKDPISGNYVPVNAVCVDHMDYLFDSYRDIIASGNAGNLYIVTHKPKDIEPTGYTDTPTPMTLGLGNPLPSLLDCALGDFNQDISNDIAVSTGDGKLYVLQNDGMGNFNTGVQTINSGRTGRMETVTFGDVNNDGWGDTVGGYQNGQFYVSSYDNTKGTFRAPYEVRAGTGALNDIEVIDLDLDGQNDLAGANNDRRWWTVRNTGKQVVGEVSGYTWQSAVPVLSGGSDLTSFATIDVNWDNSPDLISGSLDGSFYVSYNLGGTFDEGQSLRGGIVTMKDIAAGDLDLDGDIDILGLNADGWVYLVRNEFGILEDGRQLIEVGKEQNDIALGDLDNDNDLDLVCGGSKGVTIYWNNLGPFAMQIGVNDGGALKTEVQKYLQTFHGADEDYDPYGNLIVDVPLKIFSTYPGTLKFENMNVTYTFEQKVDIKTAVGLYVKANQERANTQGYVDVPVQFVTTSVGKLRISNITIHYKENIQAMIETPVSASTYNESMQIVLQGHSNFDPTCKLDGFVYTWLVDGRTVGTGCRVVVTAKDLGGIGSHNIRLTVKFTSTGEQAHSTVMINLVPNLEPNLIVKLTLDQDVKYIEDQPVTLRVTVSNNGAVNATNIGILIKDGSRRVGSKTVPLIPTGTSKPMDVNITWKPAPGPHKLCTEIVPPTRGQTISCATVTVEKKPVDYTIFAIILIVIIVMAMVAYFGIKAAQGSHERRAKKEKEEMEAKLKAQMQAEFADIYSTGGGAAGADPYAQYGGASYGAYDSYGGGSGYGEVSPEVQTFKCPRCGQPTVELGVQCFACDAKDSVKYAEEAINEVKELGIDVDEAETLLGSSKASLKAGNFEVALEESEEAEDLASEIKERYDKAFSMISAEGAETAAERRKKRLERRRAAREKKEKQDGTEGGGEGGEASPPAQPPAENQ